MRSEQQKGWATEELADVDLGDKRLKARLMKMCDRFSEAPESPINQACADWAETKAAYRFFQNENVEAGEILAAHRRKTAQRASKHKRVLAIQDTSYFVYTTHPRTAGLGKLSLKKGKNVEKIYSNGLMAHTSLAVTMEGLPLGLLDQKIFSRKLRPHKAAGKGKQIGDLLPVEEKESYRWLEALINTQEVLGDTEVSRRDAESQRGAARRIPPRRTYGAVAACIHGPPHVNSLDRRSGCFSDGCSRKAGLHTSTQPTNLEIVAPR